MNRPTSLTVFGILHIVFAALGFFGVLISFVLQSMPQDPAMANPILELAEKNPGYVLYTRISQVLSLISATVLVVAGIGLLTVRPWGRYLTLGWAVYGIISAVVGLVVSWMWLISPMLEQLGRMPDGPEKAGMVGGVIGGLVGACFAFVYPALLLIFMNRRSVLMAMRGEVPVDPYAAPTYQVGGESPETYDRY